MSDWVTVGASEVRAALPTDLEPLYAAWIINNPAKSGTLERIVADTIAQFRTAIATNRANTLDPDTTKIPQDLRPAAFDLCTHRLAMEMGVDLETAANQVRQDADQIMRQIAYGKWKVEAEGYTPSPSYRQPTSSGRTTLPTMLAILLAIIPRPAPAAWVTTTTVPDTSVIATYFPTNYTPGAATLYGHLAGLDTALARLPATYATTSAVATAYYVGSVAQFEATTANSNAGVAYAHATNAEHIASLAGTGTNAVLKTGDVMTGNLNITNAALFVGYSDGGYMQITGDDPDYARIRLNFYDDNDLMTTTIEGRSGELYWITPSWPYSAVYLHALNIGTYAVTPAAFQDAQTNFVRFMSTEAAPASNTASGTRGEMRTDATNAYFYTGSNQWLRVPGKYNW